MAGTLYEEVHSFFITSRSFILRMRHVSDKRCTHFVFNNFSLNNRAVYEIMWQTMVVGQAKDDNIIRGMRFACYEYTLRISKTYCFSTTTMVS
jgi:hypothetical protein